MTNEELTIKIKNGDLSLLPALWEQVHKLIYMLCGKYYRLHENQGIKSGITLEDLMQEGYFVMLDAISAYEEEKGYKFNAFIHYSLLNRFNELIGFRTAKGRKSALNNSVSLDKPMPGADGDLTFGDTIESPGSQNEYNRIIDTMANTQSTNIILTELQKIGALQLDIVTKVYLFGLTLTAAAELHGISIERARQIKVQAFRKLRGFPVIKKLAEDYIDDRTDFYKRKGLTGFKSSRSSVVEDVVECRERDREKFRAKHGL